MLWGFILGCPLHQNDTVVYLGSSLSWPHGLANPTNSSGNFHNSNGSSTKKRSYWPHYQRPPGLQHRPDYVPYPHQTQVWKPSKVLYTHFFVEMFSCSYSFVLLKYFLSSSTPSISRIQITRQRIFVRYVALFNFSFSTIFGNPISLTAGCKEKTRTRTFPSPGVHEGVATCRRGLLITIQFSISFKLSRLCHKYIYLLRHKNVHFSPDTEKNVLREKNIFAQRQKIFAQRQQNICSETTEYLLSDKKLFAQRQAARSQDLARQEAKSLQVAPSAQVRSRFLLLVW